MSLPSTQAAASGPDSAGVQRAALKVMTLKVTASFQLNGVFCGSVLPSAHASAAAAGGRAGGRAGGGGFWLCVRALLEATGPACDPQTRLSPRSSPLSCASPAY